MMMPMMVAAARAAAPARTFTLSWRTRPFFDSAKWNFEKANHEQLRDDQRRTPLYYEAIRSRLERADEQLTVLDLGTGPFALLALQAARCGAKKVYAIEACPLSAAKAREAVSEAGFSDVVEIVEGISTRVTLPEKVDVCVSEVIGSIASEEGLFSTMADAHARHVKRPTEQDSWIPHRCQTLGAPCTYALHHGRSHPSFHFATWSPAIDGPPRPDTDDETLWLLSSPQLLEDVRLTHPSDLLPPGTHSLTPSASSCHPATFTIEPDKVAAAEAKLASGLTGEGANPTDAEAFAKLAARSLSGVAMWPRLELDASRVVDARGPGGAHAESSWPLLLPLFDERPRTVAPGTALTVSLGVELSDAVEAPPRYSLDAELMTEEPVGAGASRVAADGGVDHDADALAPLASPLTPAPSFELLHRLAAPLRRIHLRSEIARTEAASEAAATREQRAAMRRRAWFRYRGTKRKPPVIRR